MANEEKQELQSTINALLGKLSEIREDTERNRLLNDAQFRGEVTTLLSRLEISIDGHPATAVHLIDEVKGHIVKDREHYDARINSVAKSIEAATEKIGELGTKCDEAIRVKEEQLPKWVTKLIVILVGGVGAATAAAYTIWWSLSGISKHLPEIILILEQHCK